MFPRLSPLLRNPPMALAVSRATPPLPLHTVLRGTTRSFLQSPSSLSFARKPSNFNFVLLTNTGLFNKKLKTFSQDNYRCTVWASQRGYRELRRRPAAARRSKKKKDLELNVSICIEEGLPNDPEILSIAELLRLNVPTAMKLAFDNLKSSTFKTRDEAITDVGGFDSIELSVMLCNDEFIRKLNKEWRDEDHATDVLSMSQHVPGLDSPFLMLGDVVISVETAARQAEERGHTIIDEIRVLLVHGLLHLLGFDHEISEEAEAEMDKEERVLLESLGWKGKGLIQSAYDAESNMNHNMESSDGTLLNSKSQISLTNAKALKEALSRGVKVVIATGKARPAVIDILKAVDLAGKNGIVSEFSPGVFLQGSLGIPLAKVQEKAYNRFNEHWISNEQTGSVKGLIVFGRQGREIFRSNLDLSVCRDVITHTEKISYGSNWI
ncbi:hypothetical protein SADUNF_Sadunf18G0043600 [Salix dunnii]|uniref:Uncharacterized protein n=1 Tax=Salix dunnii TaxID=1413687 RepID=A0A835J5E3_9ROSI|nr:hypothetical protein SADUNF_Sadunf18G0043600 [Salix dunnii]